MGVVGVVVVCLFGELDVGFDFGGWGIGVEVGCDGCEYWLMEVGGKILCCDLKVCVGVGVFVVI